VKLEKSRRQSKRATPLDTDEDAAWLAIGELMKAAGLTGPIAI
jgi:hypothetical protein